MAFCDGVVALVNLVERIQEHADLHGSRHDWCNYGEECGAKDIGKVLALLYESEREVADISSDVCELKKDIADKGVSRTFLDKVHQALLEQRVAVEGLQRQMKQLISTKEDDDGCKAKK